MKLIYAGVGTPGRNEPLDDAAQLYADRLKHYLKFELKLLDAGARKNAPDVTVQKEEGTRLLACASGGALKIALDERGRLFTTEQLAKKVQSWMSSGRDVVLFQGGATGLHPELLSACEEKWSLTPLTLPHRLARVVTLEALYRACTLLKGEPYHRA